MPWRHAAGNAVFTGKPSVTARHACSRNLKMPQSAKPAPISPIKIQTKTARHSASPLNPET